MNEWMNEWSITLCNLCDTFLTLHPYATILSFLIWSYLGVYFNFHLYLLFLTLVTYTFYIVPYTFLTFLTLLSFSRPTLPYFAKSVWIKVDEYILEDKTELCLATSSVCSYQTFFWRWWDCSRAASVYWRTICKHLPSIKLVCVFSIWLLMCFLLKGHCDKFEVKLFLTST